MSFNRVLGHENVIQYLKKVVKEKKLSHAIMLEGIDGIGKSLVGHELAKAILCTSKSGDACDTCRSCIKMSHDNHPDFMVIEPDGSQIKNHQIEAFQEFSTIKPYDSDYKVILIKESEKMNISSQNRILKTLEEPPEHVVMILLTENSETFLPTITSRTQIIKMQGLSEEKIITFLSKFDLTIEEKMTLAKLSLGSIGRADKYVNDESFSTIRNHVLALLNAINSVNRADLLKELTFFSDEKDKISEILDYMILWYRDILIYKKAKAKDVIVHLDSLELIKKLTRNLSMKKIIENIEIIEDTKKKLNQHSHYDLTIELMLIKLLEA